MIVRSTSRRGFGQISVLDPFDLTSDFDWCSLPFSSLFSGCAVPTPSQVLASDMSNVGPAASADTVATLQTQWAQTNASQCAANPDLCSAYNFAVANPTISALIGTSPAAQTAGNVLNVATGQASLSTLMPTWVWWALAAGAAIVLAQVARR